MKVEYSNRKNVFFLKDTRCGDVVRPTNSQVMFLTTNHDTESELLDRTSNGTIKNLVFNPQNIDVDDDMYDLIMAVSIDDGTVVFIPSGTEVEVMSCKLLVEED